MSKYTYSLTNDFSLGIDQEQLEDEIKEVISTGFYIGTHGDYVDFVFDSALNGSDQVKLNTLVSNHDPTSYPEPVGIDQFIKNGEVYVADHFPDPTHQRVCTVNEDTTDTYDDASFTFSKGHTGKYTIDNPLLAELNDNSFILIGSSYVEGSNISGQGTASASSEQQPAENANDNNSGTFWYNTSGAGAVGSWWMLDFGVVKGVYSLEVEWYSTTYYGKDVSIEWSNDATNWNLILRDQAVVYTSTGNTTGNYKFADFPSPVFARYFRIYCNASNNATYFIMKEARFFEAAGSGFQTLGSATLTSNNPQGQVCTCGWATINGCELQGTFPTGTSTKMMLSFDNQATWVYWNGSAWMAESDIANSTMTPTVFNALTSANFAEVNGLNSNDDERKLDVMINISTTDDTKSPIVNLINFNVTTIIFREQVSDSSIRVRNLTSRKTEFKNICGTDKTFHISIHK